MPHRHQEEPSRSSSADAPAGGGQRRTAAGPPVAPKLDRRTFLDDRTSSHSIARPEGHVWSIKIHDFGKQWMEASWGKVEPHSGKKREKGRSINREQNEKRARARAKGEIRRKCLTIGADHLVTFTYRDNVENRERVLRDLERLRRMLARIGYSIPYVAVLECQRRGAIHPHVAVRGFQDIRLLRRCWYQIVGPGQGQVNVKGPRPGSSPVKLARYLSKYISKDLDSLPREFEEHRYFCSLGIKVPIEQMQLVVARHAKEMEFKMYRLLLEETLRRLGDQCTITSWMGGSGTFGWMSGFADPASHWIRNRSSPLPPPTPGQEAHS